MMIEKKIPQKNKNYFETSDIKIAALLLSEVTDSSFLVFSSEENSFKKTIKITYPSEKQKIVDRNILSFANRKSRIDLYQYNIALNKLRDEIKKPARDVVR